MTLLLLGYICRIWSPSLPLHVGAVILDRMLCHHVSGPNQDRFPGVRLVVPLRNCAPMVYGVYRLPNGQGATWTESSISPLSTAHCIDVGIADPDLE